MNFLKLDSCIIMPTFDDPENDKEAERVLQELYGKRIITVEATELAKKGGLMNCITWNIKTT